MRRIERTLFGALAVLTLGACAEGLTPPAGTTAPRIAGGTFTMGSADRDPCGLATPGLLECDPLVQSEVIQHEVTVETFCLDATEVTIEQYRHCVERGDCPKAVVTNAGRQGEASFIQRYYNDPDKYGDFPVVGMTHEAAEAYCTFRGGRLPSEVEWEFAATSRGTNPTRVYGADETFDAQIDGTCDVSSNGIALGACGVKTFRAVGLSDKDVTVEGVRDLAGNAAEWVADEFSFLAYCDSDAEYVVDRPGGGQPNHPDFSEGFPGLLETAIDTACVTSCGQTYGQCEQVCRESFGVSPNVSCNDEPTPAECRFDVQRRDYQRLTCRREAEQAGAQTLNPVGIDAACDPTDPDWCVGEPEACEAFCACLAGPTPGFDFNGTECINGCFDEYAACVNGGCLTDAAEPVGIACNWEGKKPTPWCIPRKNGTSAEVVTVTKDDLQFRPNQKSYVVRGGSVADQLACLGRPTRRAVQSLPQALVGFRCAYDANSPACVAPANE